MFKKIPILNLFLIILGLVFSFWLMFHTFSFKDGSLQIASKVWSDFGSNIPLIRSFSFGENFPPQNPIFPGPPINYHFLFYLLVGVLEKTGLRIDLALNIPSALGFFSLLLMIYKLSKLIFKSKAVAIISVVFFLFNGTLSFLYFFEKHSLSANILNEIIKNKDYASFQPYGNGLISAFWNLNIFTNQRHLAPAFAFSFFTLYLLLKHLYDQKTVKPLLATLLGFLLGLSYFFHTPIFIMTLIVLGIFFLLFKNLRLPIFIIFLTCLILAIPQYLYTKSAEPGFKIIFKPGYLISDNLTFKNFINYWWLNLGLHSILMVLGFFLAPSKAKKIFLSIIPLFVIGNLFQFSPEIAANHKFFNYFIIIGYMFSAYSVVFFWQTKKFKVLAVTLLFFCTFSGFLDLFPVVNDFKYNIADYPKNPDIAWIIKNTPPSSIFLNTNYFYEPASLAGRKIFNGWGYFTWSSGYDSFKRTDIQKKLLNPTDIKDFCSIANQYNLSYLSVKLQDVYTDFIFNKDFFDHSFPKIYINPTNTFNIYQLKAKC